MGANSRFTVAIHSLLLLDGPEGGWTTSDWIAGSVNTNPVVIRRLLQRLQRAGLVEGQKGARGGYRLRVAPSEVTLWQVYEALRDEGPFGLHTAPPNARCPIGGCIQEPLQQIYDETETSMKKVLQRTTLRSLHKQVTAGAR